MQPFFGLFNLGGGELVLILALVLILFGAKKLPDLAKGFGDGLLNFRKAIDEEATEAGRSLGGIYGKPAAEALTTDNQVAELYEPAVLQNNSESRKRFKRFTKLLINIFERMRFFFRRNRRS